MPNGGTNRLQLLLQTQSTPMFHVYFSCDDMADMVEFIAQSDIPRQEVFKIRNMLTEDELFGSQSAFDRDT